MKAHLERGQAMMIATVIFVVVSITIIFGLVGPVLSQQKISSQLTTSRQSYFAAEAGMEDIWKRLNTGNPVGVEEFITLLGNNASISISDIANGKLIVSTGDASNNIRKVSADLILGTPVAFTYGVMAGTGGFTLGNNAGVNGDIYSNANISGSNGAFIEGDVYVAGSITNVDVSGTTETGVPPLPLPISDEQILEWKNAAEAGGAVGGQSISGSSNTLGPKKIQGNLTINNGATLTVSGTLWVTGTLTISNNATIRLSSSYGTAGGVVIIEGVSTLSNGSTMAGSGTGGSYIMLISTNTGANAIRLENNGGSVVLYAPSGTVAVNNNATVEQITAKNISLSNNAEINYDPSLDEAVFSSGPDQEYNIFNWREVE